MELFKYFVKYCNDPASTSHQCNGRHYSDVAKEQFYTLSTEYACANSMLRYQAIVEIEALKSGRFRSIKKITNSDGCFSAIIDYMRREGSLYIYVSINSRFDLMDEEYWNELNSQLESFAIADPNRSGDYLCVIGMANENGDRCKLQTNSKSRLQSHSTEIWLSDFFWPFFTNFSYKEISLSVLSALIETQIPDTHEIVIPNDLIEVFGKCCRNEHLIDEIGKFNDSIKLARLMCKVKRFSYNNHDVRLSVLRVSEPLVR